MKHCEVLRIYNQNSDIQKRYSATLKPKFKGAIKTSSIQWLVVLNYTDS